MNQDFNSRAVHFVEKVNKILKIMGDREWEYKKLLKKLVEEKICNERNVVSTVLTLLDFGIIESRYSFDHDFEDPFESSLLRRRIKKFKLNKRYAGKVKKIKN